VFLLLMARLLWLCMSFVVGTNVRIQVSLHHGDTKVAQLRVEEWLAAVDPPVDNTSINGDSTSIVNGDSNVVSGLDNGSLNGDSIVPKQKEFYGKVVELYCLFLLPRNQEWEFANTFINMNDYLSSSKKKV
jgi:hypothetical protein